MTDLQIEDCRPEGTIPIMVLAGTHYRSMPYGGAKLHSQVHVTPTIIPSAAAPSRALPRHADRQFGEAMLCFRVLKTPTCVCRTAPALRIQLI